MDCTSVCEMPSMHQDIRQCRFPASPSLLLRSLFIRREKKHRENIGLALPEKLRPREDQQLAQGTPCTGHGAQAPQCPALGPDPSSTTHRPTAHGYSQLYSFHAERYRAANWGAQGRLW